MAIEFRKSLRLPGDIEAVLKVQEVTGVVFNKAITLASCGLSIGDLEHDSSNGEVSVLPTDNRVISIFDKRGWKKI